MTAPGAPAPSGPGPSPPPPLRQFGPPPPRPQCDDRPPLAGLCPLSRCRRLTALPCIPGPAPPSTFRVWTAPPLAKCLPAVPCPTPSASRRASPGPESRRSPPTPPWSGRCAGTNGRFWRRVRNTSPKRTRASGAEEWGLPAPPLLSTSLLPQYYASRLLLTSWALVTADVNTTNVRGRPSRKISLGRDLLFHSDRRVSMSLSLSLLFFLSLV